MNNLDIVRKNLTPDVKCYLNEEADEFIMLKPMNMMQQAKIAELAPKFEALKKSKEGTVEIDPKILEDISIVLASVIERSVEGITTEEADNFVAGHLNLLMEMIDKLLPGEESKMNTDLIKEKIKEAQN